MRPAYLPKPSNSGLGWKPTDLSRHSLGRACSSAKSLWWWCESWYETRVTVRDLRDSNIDVKELNDKVATVVSLRIPSTLSNDVPLVCAAVAGGNESQLGQALGITQGRAGRARRDQLLALCRFTARLLMARVRTIVGLGVNRSDLRRHIALRVGLESAQEVFQPPHVLETLQGQTRQERVDNLVDWIVATAIAGDSAAFRRRVERRGRSTLWGYLNAENLTSCLPDLGSYFRSLSTAAARERKRPGGRVVHSCTQKAGCCAYTSDCGDNAGSTLLSRSCLGPGTA